MNDFHLACFASLSRTHSFLLTAKSFSVSTQAVIRSIRRLEEELGYPLFLYRNQEARLTEAGRQFMKHYLFLDRNYAEASDFFRLPLENTLTAATCDSVDYPAPLLDRLRELQADQPDRKIRYLTGTVDQVIAFVRDGVTDIALLPEPALPLDSPLWDHQVLPLCELPLWCMLSSEYCPGGTPDLSVFHRLPCYLAPGEEHFERYLEERRQEFLQSLGAAGGPCRSLQNACSLYTEVLCGAAYTISAQNPMTERLDGITALPVGGAPLRIMGLIRKESLHRVSLLGIFSSPEDEGHE